MTTYLVVCEKYNVAAVIAAVLNAKERVASNEE
jgi:hypothetical protein